MEDPGGPLGSSHLASRFVIDSQVDPKEPTAIPTSGTAVTDLIEWLKNGLVELDYGEIGLTFSVRAGKVTRVSKLQEEKYVVSELDCT